ncbi:helix-turn-helix transcriptional regulator [Cellulomonas sp. C5510]|uniref:helix-turn-helix transcriptional regulator n=1 Tax=Cellulomonas sp. C5510 TaxID=2871170 RepID=UPI001C94C5C3|nr:helix-turn-helix transcriptional regulator [Cellulomonas sp. C5510]QZN84333.1 helix-turn-helix transcriptional regulator [Cellulomonas sp. C5510]
MRDDVVLHPDTVSQIVGYLQDGTHVQVVGMRAAGRSSVLEQVADRLAGLGIAAVRLRGVRALRDRTLGALAVAGVPLPSAPQQLRMLSAAVESLEQMLAAPGSVLLVDDADDLDSGTVGAVLAARARLGTRVVIACGRGGGPAAGLLADGLQPSARVAVDPLPFAGVHRLLHTMLGRGVEPTAVARVAAATGGLPGLVQALVDTARRENRLVVRDGLWVARGDLWTASLAQTVEPFLADLDDDLREALTVLAFAGTVSLAAAGRLAGTAALVRLEESGLVQVVTDGDHALVGVFPPLLADCLVQESATTRGLLVRARVAEELQGEESLPAGVRTAAPLAGRLIAQRWEQRCREARRRWEADPSARAGAELLEAMLLTHARPHQVEHVLDRTRADAGDPADRAAFVAAHAAYRGRESGSPVAAALVVAELADDLPGHGPALGAVLDHLALTGGAPLGRESSPPDGAPEPDDELARAVRAESLVATGRAREALALLDGPEPQDAQARWIAGTARGLALLYTCDVAAAATTALAGVERARQELDPVSLLAHASVAGLALAVQGRAMELDALACDALALSTACPQEPQLVTGLIALAAEAATWQGHREFAESLAVQARSLPSRRGPHPYQSSDLVAPLIQDEDDPAVAAETADRIWQVAVERLEAGYLPAGIVAGVAAVERRPDAARAAVLADAAARCDAPLLTHLAAFAAAVASGDPDRLAALEPELRRAGLRQFAVRAAVARAVRLLADGQPAAAIERADTAWSQGGLRGRDLCGLFLPFDRAVRLTSREREVAVLVARGLSSPEIATRMVLSARTVEHHILSACRKVGVNSREGLARAARTWLTCTQR